MSTNQLCYIFNLSILKIKLKYASNHHKWYCSANNVQLSKLSTFDTLWVVNRSGETQRKVGKHVDYNYSLSG